MTFSSGDPQHSSFVVHDSQLHPLVTWISNPHFGQRYISPTSKAFMFHLAFQSHSIQVLCLFGLTSAAGAGWVTAVRMVSDCRV